MNKLCRGCGHTKTPKSFSKKTSNADGLAHRCKDCRKLYRQTGKVPKEARAQKVIYKRSPKASAAPMLSLTGVCHQKLRRDATEEEDRAAGCQFDLEPKNFQLASEKLTREHSYFIERYEWLGKIGWAVKWCFTARHKGKLAGVVLMSEPTMATKYKEYEALIQRGAASSWAPKNLNSMLVMFACRWMVANTSRRLFTCYSDPSAGEIGTIYQACNFLYLGTGWGTKQGVMLPNGKIVSKREFTKTSSMKRWAKELGIPWQSEWSKPNGYQDIRAIPAPVLIALTRRGKAEGDKYPKATQPSKGKYALILGRDKKEERQLKQLIQFTSFPYPKRK